MEGNLNMWKFRVRFSGKIRDWISDLRSHGFLATKETKNPFSDYFVTSHEIMLIYETMNGATKC